MRKGKRIVSLFVIFKHKKINLKQLAENVSNLISFQNTWCNMRCFERARKGKICNRKLRHIFNPRAVQNIVKIWNRHNLHRQYVKNNKANIFLLAIFSNYMYELCLSFFHFFFTLKKKQLNSIDNVYIFY